MDDAAVQTYRFVRLALTAAVAAILIAFVVFWVLQTIENWDTGLPEDAQGAGA
jgi:hypothetical protein